MKRLFSNGKGLWLLALVSAAAAVWLILRKRMEGTYFSVSELCASSTARQRGIDNTPTPEARQNLLRLILEVLDPCRRQFGAPVRVTSGYRCPQLNRLVGGAASSQHLSGEAADITGGSVERNRKLFAILAAMEFDQLIWEQGGQWVHVSYRHGANRRQMLSYSGGSYTQINANWRNVVGV